MFFCRPSSDLKKKKITKKNSGIPSGVKQFGPDLGPNFSDGYQQTTLVGRVHLYV